MSGGDGPVYQLDRSVFELVESPGDEGATWVSPVVDLDLRSASDGFAQLLTIWQDGPPDGRLVVELGAGCFADVRGLRMLLEIGRALRGRGGAMAVVSPSHTVERVLAVLDPDGELPFSRSVADAQQELRRGPDRAIF